MRGGVQHFEIKTAWDQGSGVYQRVQIARCSKCPHTCAIHDAAHRPTAISVMAQKFRRKGWTIAPRPGADLCPRCSAPKPKPVLSPAQKRAAFCRIAGVQPAVGSPARPIATPAQEAVMPATAPRPAAAVVPLAAPPRQPTREDRRRIMEALDVEYLFDKACYAKSGSDKALAERLGVPRAWVSEERDRAYGPDACEADGQDRALLEALAGRAARAEADAMAAAELAETLGRDIARLQAKIVARGVA
jgi:hypothetical protein